MREVPFNDFVKAPAAQRMRLDQALKRVVEGGWYILGKEGEAFESEFAGYLGVKHFVGMGNGLDALHASLLALAPRFGHRKQVITTPVSAFATTLAILQAGLEPVFADIDPATGNIDPTQVERKTGRGTAALLPVHLYGRDCGVEKLRELATSAGVLLIEDAAQAAGTLIGSPDGGKAGTRGDAGCFSFYPTKNLGTLGDGGGVATNDDAAAASIRIASPRSICLSDQGAPKRPRPAAHAASIAWQTGIAWPRGRREPDPS